MLTHAHYRYASHHWPKLEFLLLLVSLAWTLMAWRQPEMSSYEIYLDFVVVMMLMMMTRVVVAVEVV